MAITLRQESATGATTKGSALSYAELDNNFIHLLRQGSVTVRADSGTDQTLGEEDTDSILQLVGGTNVTTAISSDSAGETMITITATDTGITDIVEDTTPQLGGNLDGQGNKVEDVELDNYKETINAIGNTSGALTIDVANGNLQTLTLTGNATLDGFANPEVGQSVTLIITQDGTGSRTLTFGDSAGRFLFAGGNDTLSTAGGSIDIVSIVYDGTIYYASLATDFQ